MTSLKIRNKLLHMKKILILSILFFFNNNFVFSQIINLNCLNEQAGQTYPIQIDLKKKTVFEKFKFEKESTSEDIKFIEWQKISKEVGKEYAQKFHNLNLKSNTWKVEIIFAGHADLISEKYNFSNYPPEDLIVHRNNIKCKRQ